MQDALVCVYVDGFGADPSGETDSTDAVLRAVKTVATLLTSGYDNTNSKYAVVVFGNGTYVIGDVPFFSGIRYVGQGEYATRIQPKPGAQYCFTTVGTKNIDQAASASDRLFYSGVCRMSIGCGYQTANTPYYTEPPENVGGIFVKSASYMRFEHLDIRFLDGCGIDAVELFDSDIRHVKMMSVGNARDTSSIESIVPALRLMPDGGFVE
ncbi:glycosyl hydrolase family 28-related protein [Klebsiella pneumoniae]|uniref:glycosyl hydrolase family 28-related protein n=2 Tax=Klebsiella pneumoniae TaxID=573 RepID=UPI003B25D12C